MNNFTVKLRIFAKLLVRTTLNTNSKVHVLHAYVEPISMYLKQISLLDNSFKVPRKIYQLDASLALKVVPRVILQT